MQLTDHPMTIDQLDQLLDGLCDRPDAFAQKAKRLARSWNKAGHELELRDPLLWRGQASRSSDGKVASIQQQLRSEIESIAIMDRDEEGRHARRIEFARLRLELAMASAGLNSEDLEGKVEYSPSTYRSVSEATCALPENICRRWVELHHLRTELVERNLYLAIINAERYAHLGVSKLDLIQEGSAALFKAVDGFDWKRGLLFRTYAVHWLNQAYRSFLYNHGQTVRVPVYLQKAMKHVRTSQARLGPDASAAEIAEDTGIAEHVVVGALGAAKSTLSIDAPFQAGDDSGGLASYLSQSDDSGVYSTAMEDTSLEHGIHGAMDRLSERERFVVERRFGIGVDREYTLSEVAASLGVSLERVRQIQVRAIAKMRTPMLRKAIDPFL